MLRAKNEWKACDAVIRVLEARVGAMRENAHSPERTRVGPPVEYRFDLDGTHYALEHTYIEPFEDEVRSGAHFSEFLKPIVKELGNTMPRPGFFKATFPLDPSAGMKPRERAEAQKRVVAWLRDAAKRLHDKKPELGKHDLYPHDAWLREKPEGLTFEIHLARELFRDMPEKAMGRLVISRLAPEGYEELRVDRIRRSFNAKCPKLERCRTEGARPVLALESNDISLTNHVLVGDAVEKVLAERSDAPAEVFYVDTTIEESWTVWSVYRDGVMWPDEETPQRYQEFAPGDLSKI
jgi:hypothetical protein